MNTYLKIMRLLPWVVLLLAFHTTMSAPLGLLTSNEKSWNIIPPYLSSSGIHLPHREYLHLNHLRKEEGRVSNRGVRPVLLTRPMPAPDARLPKRPHLYSLLYLHYVPESQLDNMIK